MSHLRTLDEIPSEELVKELQTRQLRLDNCLCPYCAKPLIGMDGNPATSRKQLIRHCICRFGDTERYHNHQSLLPLRGM